MNVCLYLEGLSLVSDKLSPVETDDLSVKSDEPRDSADIEDKSSIVYSILFFVLIMLYQQNQIERFNDKVIRRKRFISTRFYRYSKIFYFLFDKWVHLKI